MGYSVTSTHRRRHRHLLVMATSYDHITLCLTSRTFRNDHRAVYALWARGWIAFGWRSRRDPMVSISLMRDSACLVEVNALQTDDNEAEDELWIRISVE